MMCGDSGNNKLILENSYCTAIGTSRRSRIFITGADNDDNKTLIADYYSYGQEDATGIISDKELSINIPNASSINNITLSRDGIKFSILVTNEND